MLNLYKNEKEPTKQPFYDKRFGSKLLRQCSLVSASTQKNKALDQYDQESII